MMKKIVWKFGVAALAILGWCVSAVADGVAVTSSAGAITVTVSAGTVASSAPVYLVWDTENKGDILSAWTHRAKIGEVTSTGGVFNVTGATHSIPDGAVIRVFVVDGTYDVCEYLQGDGNAYLELDYTLSSADEVTIVAMPNNSTDQSGVFGARDSASSQNFTMARTTNSKVVVDVNDKSGYSNYRLDTGWNVGAKVTFVASVARRTANGTGKTNLCPDTFTTAYSCRLFSYAGAMPSSYATAFNGRVYSFKISTLATSAVQRDLVAVNLGTDANPIPGMYDKETGATYENESPVAGAAFTLGPKTGESVGEEKTLAFSSEATYEAGEEPPPDEPIVDPSEYGTTCLTLPVGSGVNGVDSTATFATLGVSTAYTYAFSMKNPKAQTSVNKRYYGHIMGAGASNTKNGLQGNGAPLVFETNDTTGERFIEMQTWTSGGKAQCLTILGYSASNTSWSQSKSQEVEALEDGNWHNVVFTYDATAQHAQVFVDGVKLHDITSSNISQYLNWCDKTLNNEVFATPSDSGTFCIGRNSEKNDNFAGSLSNVSVWNRALSAEEAVAISGSRLAGNESGLVLYWPLDGETGDVTASDHQVNITAHDGTVYSAGTTACGTYWEEMGTTEPTVVTVTPNANQAKTVGDDDPTLTYTLSQTIAVTGTLARATGEDVGAYAINLGTLGAADPTAYTLMLAATPVYFSITNAVTPPTPPEPPTGGVEVSSSEGQITVTIAADTVASSTPVYLVWDTVADKGDAFAGWTHSAKIGDVDAAGGVFNVTGATHSILNGAAIRVFVRDGVALYSAIVKPRTVNAAIVTGYVPGVTRGTAGWDLDAKFDTSYVQVTDGNNFMGVYERFALGGSNFERFSANFGTNATDGKNVYAWPHAVNHPSAAATARYIVDENASGTQLRATRNVISARLGEYLKWGDKNTSSSTYLQKWPDQITHDFNAPVAIFGVSDWTSATSSSLMYMQIYSMTLYGARFYDKVNDELTVAADYVPAEKNGEKGLYDTMNGVFYPASAEGFTFEGAATNTIYTDSAASDAATYSEGGEEPGIQVGDNLTATFKNGVCTISGTGAMWDKDALDDLRALAITNLVIGEGVTSIGASAFEKMKSIHNVTIGSTVTSIGQQTFHKCYNLTNVVIHTGATAPTVGEYAFFRCNSLVRITVTGGSSVNWGENAFTLQAGIFMNSDTGLPEIYPIPEIVDGNGSATVLYGTNDLNGDWMKITSDADRANYHFFKIKFEKK